MITTLPGIGTALRLAVASVGALEDAIGLVPRTAALLTSAEAVVGRVEMLLERIEPLVADVQRIVDDSRTTAQGAAEVVGTAGAVAEGARAVVRRSELALGSVESSVVALAPHARRLAETLDPDEVEAIVRIVDLLPTVLVHLEEDVVPMMRNLDRVGPDIHAILEIVEDLRRVLSNLPGVSLLRRRDAQEDDEV